MSAKKNSTPEMIIDCDNSVTTDELAMILNKNLDMVKNDLSASRMIPALIVHGSPGCGKSSVVARICSERGIELKDIRLAQIEPTDVRGLPVADRENRRMEWFVNSSWPTDPVYTFVNDSTSVSAAGFDGGISVDTDAGRVEVSPRTGFIPYMNGFATVKYHDGSSKVVKSKNGSFSFDFPEGAWKSFDVVFHKSGVILLDEITSADRQVQGAAYQLVLDRCLDNIYSIPPGYIVVAAGNNTTDKAISYVMSSALANRFTHVELKFNVDTWLDWARNNGVHPAVTGFIKSNSHQLFRMDGETLDRGWPSPRSWEMTSKYCHMYGGNGDFEILRKLVYGTVGVGAGSEFMEFYRVNEEFVNTLELMLNPDLKFELPLTRTDKLHALCSSMLYLLWQGRTKDDQTARIKGFIRICTMLPSDFATWVMLASIKGRDKDETKLRARAIMNDPSFAKWSEKHGKELRENFDVSKLFS